MSIAIKVENVSKEYRLGAIGGGTLRGDIQSKWAKKRGKEDPNLKIGEESHSKNEKFLALQNINFEVEKGKALGIIGHNGAGKSTLLKLLSRVTAPTTGRIGLNGRIASMLEVGTGFHPELTGRENVYMNGAILGMTKEEITRKFDQIVEFAEMSKFIDTPVKRYSSGMYVKLAFAVAAHLDSEILVMDEVLAVGDMKFQQKCLGKMNDVAKNEGRTILYVSHNMGTVRQLCDSCLVLNHGEIEFNGETDKAIDLYFGTASEYKLFHESRYGKGGLGDEKCRVLSTQLFGEEGATYLTGDNVDFEINIGSNIDIPEAQLQFIVKTGNDIPTGSSFADKKIAIHKGNNTVKGTLSLDHFTPGGYDIDVVVKEQSELGSFTEYDRFKNAITISVMQAPGFCDNNPWYHRTWGYARYDELTIKESI